MTSRLTVMQSLVALYVWVSLAAGLLFPGPVQAEPQASSAGCQPLPPATGTIVIEYRFSVSSGALAYNLTGGPIQQRDSAQGTPTGNLTNAQPGRFANPAAGDLHLSASATAAIDQAAPLAGVTLDYDGHFRGLAPDVGADEYGSVAFVPTDWVYLPFVRR